MPLTDEVIERLWQQRDLASIFSLDESLHGQPVLWYSHNLGSRAHIQRRLFTSPSLKRTSA